MDIGVDIYIYMYILIYVYKKRNPSMFSTLATDNCCRLASNTFISQQHKQLEQAVALKVFLLQNFQCKQNANVTALNAYFVHKNIQYICMYVSEFVSKEITNSFIML